MRINNITLQVRISDELGIITFINKRVIENRNASTFIPYATTKGD